VILCPRWRRIGRPNFSSINVYSLQYILSIIHIYMRVKQKIKLNILVSSSSISFTWAQHRRSFDSKQLKLGVLALIVYPVLDRTSLRTNRKFERRRPRNIQNVEVCTYSHYNFPNVLEINVAFEYLHMPISTLWCTAF